MKNELENKMEKYATQDQFYNLSKQILDQQQGINKNDENIQSLNQLIEDNRAHIDGNLGNIANMEDHINKLMLDLRQKVSVHELYNQLKNKAPVDKVRTLEENLVSLNEFVNNMQSVFADKVENDVAHQLLQKNLKNLYDLFVALKNDMANTEDPMITTKTFCTSCTKSVTNL